MLEGAAEDSRTQPQRDLLTTGRVIERTILYLLGRDPDPLTHALALRAFERGGEAAMVRALTELPEFVQRVRREAASPKADAWGQGHFHSPLPDPASVQADYERTVDASVRALPGIDLREDAQRELVMALSRFLPEMPWKEHAVAGLRYYEQNQFFPGGDAMLLYGMLRHFRPQRVVEIGSGFSSAVMLDTDELFLGGTTRFDFVEPYPDRLLHLIRRGSERRTIHRKPVQEVPLELAVGLAAGDMLFVDSSHVVKFGSDVLWILNEILPRLAPGVLVHFHDIFWPFDYPKEWYARGWAWNEGFALRHFLTFNSRFRILCFGDWLRRHEREWLGVHMPLLPQYASGSLWLERTQ